MTGGPPSELGGGWLVLAGVRFLAELGLLAAFGYVGVRIALGAGWGTAAGLVAAIVLAALAASVWGRWVSPKAPARLADPARLAVELALFGTAGVALAVLGRGWLALALVAAYAVSAPVGRRGF